MLNGVEHGLKLLLQTVLEKNTKIWIFGMHRGPNGHNLANKWDTLLHSHIKSFCFTVLMVFSSLWIQDINQKIPKVKPTF